MCITNKNKFNNILEQTILPKIKLPSNKILNNNINCSYCKILES
jgi:hypothetical protein